MIPPPAPAERSPSRFFTSLILTLVLGGSFLVKLNHLGHPGLKGLDESFHALVAKNLLKHPLTPTLYDRPYLPYDYRVWQTNHVWLHKPIVPLWQMALSMALLGTSTLALRLPSAILATAAVWLTYAIGRELIDRRAALIAAAIQAFNPAITSLVHGYVFSDHVDVAFLFWVELAVWLLVRAIQSGSVGWTVAAGMAQGIAFLSKTYPALVIGGMAAVAIVLPQARFRFRHLMLLIAATVATIAPWTIYCAIHFPREFLWEQVQILRHLGADVEGWAAPWDRLLFDYSLRIYHVFYPSVLVAAIVLFPRAWRERNIGLAILFAWGLGVLIPNTLAVSKTPTATLIGWPPFLLLLGAMISRAVDGDTTCLGAWLGATVLAVIAPGSIPERGRGYPDLPHFAAIMRQHVWIAYHVLAALLLALTAGRLQNVMQRLRVPLICLATMATLYLAALLAHISRDVTLRDNNNPSFTELASFVLSNLPDNAVLLMEDREKCEHIMAMFEIDRTIYIVAPTTIQETALQVSAAGGIPFLVTDRSIPLAPLTSEFLDGLRIYSLPAPATKP